ncbi:MAG: bifunctional 23S rRNA (guanine(2069)-N(7))-methyltransferase RlmK/23S rRNA (guanine(2445)-N(2))-methyltransferase RlmL [bacterium]|nr:bifunctional 23S rRNA (guanine(2069)-N(7))-methyltransferase RlmK/23S rRNA (guanine(2445)-N(2))-methyltransferase RlmL [bacterium]
MRRFFATASRGTEDVLAQELRQLGIDDVEAQRGGVAFGTRLEDGYLACLWSRVASRVLMPLDSFEIQNADELYDAARGIDWTDHLGADRTLAVDAAGGRCPAGPRHYVALKTKDAIVDCLREAEGGRPDVDTKNPDVRINLHLDGPRVTVNLDLGGGSLHRRGIGRAGAEAPLKENLAAAILRIARWPERSADAPLFDPLCGSGTLLLEAAWMALDIAPGLLRGTHGMSRWRGHDAATWQRLRGDAIERRDAGAEHMPRVAGSDASAATLRLARENFRRAGLTRLARLATCDLSQVVPPWDTPGLVVTNPPYGERLGESGELVPLYQELGDVLRRRFPGWSAWVFTGNPELGKRIGLKPASRHVLYNGPIESRLIEIPISDKRVAGEGGPAWRQASPESGSFAKRLKKNLRELRPWARRERLTCYRMYDADVPQYNVAVDWWDGAARVEEYARPKKVSAEDAERRVRDALLVTAEVLDLEPSLVTLRVRSRRADGEQHGRRGDSRRVREVQEGDLRFQVNLDDYLDTGLFLDDRLLRRRIRERVEGKSFLNLFAYTCAASVAAAAGGARTSTSVDLSNTYLEWGKRNFALNELSTWAHRFVRADALQWLARGGDRKHYDLIFVAPPTYSKSKGMQQDFDVQRDHGRLLSAVARRLAPGGEILFTTNLKTFVFEAARPGGLAVREITEEVTPRDFARRPRLKAWQLRDETAS